MGAKEPLYRDWTQSCIEMVVKFVVAIGNLFKARGFPIAVFFFLYKKGGKAYD